MNRQRQTSASRRRAPVVLAFGEDLHDSDSIKRLVSYFRSDAPKVLSRPKPISLSGNPGQTAVNRWVKDLRDAVASTEAAGQPVAAVLVHVDSDVVDPDGQRYDQIASTLSALDRVRLVMPVRCTEAWWFLFPDQVEAVRPRAWRNKLPRRPRNVEAIEAPKTELKRLTRTSGHEYSESDSAQIAENIATARVPPIGTSQSFDRFRDAVMAL